MSASRELNPQLFGTKSALESMGSPVDTRVPAQGIMGRSQESAPKPTAYPPSEIKALEHQISTLKLSMIQMERRAESMTLKMEEIVKSVQGRLERFSQAISRCEDALAQNNRDATAKFAQIGAKVNERKMTDQKVQELVDRHNTIIRNFENRLASLQRLVGDQEVQIHNSQAALDEARSEIVRLRRA